MVKSWDKCLKTSEIEYFYEMLTLNNFLEHFIFKTKLVHGKPLWSLTISQYWALRYPEPNAKKITELAQYNQYAARVYLK